MTLLFNFEKKEKNYLENLFNYLLFIFDLVDTMMQVMCVFIKAEIF